jgi:hypothetical protein
VETILYGSIESIPKVAISSFQIVTGPATKCSLSGRTQFSKSLPRRRTM